MTPAGGKASVRVRSALALGGSPAVLRCVWYISERVICNIHYSLYSLYVTLTKGFVPASMCEAGKWKVLS